MAQGSTLGVTSPPPEPLSPPPLPPPAFCCRRARANSAWSTALQCVEAPGFRSHVQLRMFNALQAGLNFASH